MTEVMNAWVTDGKGGIALREIPIPTPKPDEALIQCHATMVSRGEVRHLAYMPEGRVIGLDLAGVVVKQAADGSGPPAGARVIAMTGHAGGGWGQMAALPATTLGVIPDTLSWAEAGMLPNQGLTAFYSVRHGELLVGKRVLITGITGGVARIAAQLAKLAGAEVSGTVSKPARAEAVKSLGLSHVAVGNEVEGPFDLIVDTIGGTVLGHALEIVGPEGVVVTMGGGDGFDAHPDPAVVPNGWFFKHPGARLQAENVGIRVIRRTGVAENLAMLANLVTTKQIDLEVEQEVTWREGERLMDELKAGAPAVRVALILD
jgi:NADPH:quinone reductase-like Zn-dependent oxidoreductase